MNVWTFRRERRGSRCSLLPLLGLLGAFLSLAACQGGGAQPHSELSFDELGARVYGQYCAACHQPDGQGLAGLYPPLHRTDWVLGDKGRLIRLTLNGVAGPMTVDGQQYDNVMTPHGFLDDRELAAVLTFVRSQFSNDAEAVTPEEVQAVRRRLPNQKVWNVDDLRDATGIPSLNGDE